MVKKLSMDDPVANWTDLEVFDFVEDHLLKQGKKAVNGNGSCQYLGMNDCKCAVGCLIHPDLYRRVIEGNSVEKLAEKFKGMSKALGIILDKEDRYNNVSSIDISKYPRLRLLMLLQEVHDRNEPAYWPDHLKHLRSQFFAPSTETAPA